MKEVRARLWRAIRLGIKITVIPFLAVLIGDLVSPYPDLPTFQRNPAAWSFYWPVLFWTHGENMKDWDFIGSLLVNILVYSLLAYLALSLLTRRM